MIENALPVFMSVRVYAAGSGRGVLVVTVIAGSLGAVRGSAEINLQLFHVGGSDFIVEQLHGVNEMGCEAQVGHRVDEAQPALFGCEVRLRSVTDGDGVVEPAES